MEGLRKSVCVQEMELHFRLQQECKTASDSKQQVGGLGGAGGAGGPALEGELDFSALDDDLLPLTTLADMCEQ